MSYVLDKDWSEKLSHSVDVEFKKKLFAFINQEYATKTVFPPKEKIFNSFPEREKQVAQLYYQELKSKEEIAKELSLSETGVQELVYEVAKKLRSDYYNASLRKFVEEHDWNRNYSLKDIIK